MIAWMIYGMLVALLLGVAAMALERALHEWRVPTRWAWVASLTGSVLLPLVFAASRHTTSEPSEAGGAGVGELVLVGGAAPPAGAWYRELPAMSGWSTPLLLLWLAASACLLLLLLASRHQLARRRSAWQPALLGGRQVLLSDDTGPAVVGFLRSAIVLPTWVTHLDAVQRELMVAHEEEHLRAGDPRLLLLALVLLVLFPWNLPLWWQTRRLRLAIEIDCDRRVLARSGDVRAYGALLVEVGGRRQARSRLAVAAFSEPSSQLERRIRMMTSSARTRRWLPTLAASLAAIGVATAACTLDQPQPVVPALTGTQAPTTEAGPALEKEPTFTPYDRKPELVNRQAAAEALEQAYPPLLREAGIGGTAVMWVFIDQTGMVRDARVSESSGHAELDQAARSALLGFRFTPAAHQGTPVPVWIQLPVTFRARAEQPAGTQYSPEQVAAEVERISRAAFQQQEQRAAAPTPADTPVFTPYDIKPELRNRQEFARGLLELYPPLLKDAGIGGTTMLWVFIDRSGRVTDTRVARSSGHDALDRAAQTTMLRAEFTPARNQGEPVGVWIQLPITFQTRPKDEH